MTPSRTLARDYNHVRRNTSGSPAFTGWMGLLIGLAIGLAVALGVFLHYRNPPSAQPMPAKVKGREASASGRRRMAARTSGIAPSMASLAPRVTAE